MKTAREGNRNYYFSKFQQLQSAAFALLFSKELGKTNPTPAIFNRRLVKYDISVQ